MVRFYTTVDLDNCNYEQMERIRQKIMSMKCCEGVFKKPSARKGYHLLVWCKVKCDLCRMVFDDQKRFEQDLKRPEKWRNVLFDEKMPIS